MSPSVETQPRRNLIHTRRVNCEVYMRENGLIEIEGTMLDCKPEAVEVIGRIVPANEPFHHMRLTLTVDADHLIHDVKAETLAAPTPSCGDITSAYRALIGQRVGPGLKKAAALYVGGMQGCTHLTELLGPMATALIQSTYVGHMKALRRQLEENPDFVMSKPWLIGTCHAYDSDGEAARWIWPVKHRKAD